MKKLFFIVTLALFARETYASLDPGYNEVRDVAQQLSRAVRVDKQDWLPNYSLSHCLPTTKYGPFVFIAISERSDLEKKASSIIDKNFATSESQCVDKNRVRSKESNSTRVRYVVHVDDAKRASAALKALLTEARGEKPAAQREQEANSYISQFVAGISDFFRERAKNAKYPFESSVVSNPCYGQRGLGFNSFYGFKIYADRINFFGGVFNIGIRTYKTARDVEMDTSNDQIIFEREGTYPINNHFYRILETSLGKIGLCH